MAKDNRDKLMKWVVYLACAWISIKYADGLWVVGPIFGLAVVAYDSKFFRNFSREKHLAFLTASTLIYALVYWTAMRRWETRSELINYLIGPFAIGVVLGSILLPSVHKKVFKKSNALTKRVVLSLIASFYSVSFIAYLSNQFGIGPRFNFASVAIAVWQGIYLYLFFKA